MLQFEELRLELNDNKQKLSELREALGLDALKEEIAKLEEQTAAEEFWGDIENSQKVLQRISQLKNKVAAYTSLETAFDDTMTLIELADEEEDLSMFDECREGVTKFEDPQHALKRRIRREERTADFPRGRGRNRGAGLDADARPYVSALGREAQLQGQHARLS